MCCGIQVIRFSFNFCLDLNKILVKKMSDDEIMFNVLINDVIDAEEQVDVYHGRNHFQHVDPIVVLSNNLFVKHFRLSKNSFQNLLQDLTELLQPVQRRRGSLDLKTKLLVSLLFYAQGSYQSVTGSNFFTGMHQSTVSRCINEITNALNHQNIVGRWVHFPQNIQEMTVQRTRFYNNTHMPGGVGIIDCTHVAIAMPENDENIFVNRKNYHSLNVQLICDENLKILNVDASFPGSTHDAYIWSESRISRIMEQLYTHDPRNNFFLLADSGYPLRPWILTPLRETEPGTPEERFNLRFKSIRSKIERCNGLLKNRFRCLLKHRVLHYKPEKASKIILACVVLHNICIDNQQIEDPELEEEINQDQDLIEDNIPVVDNAVGNAYLIAGRQLRENIIQNHFN